MKLSVKKTVQHQETCEMELPAYFRFRGYVVKIGEDQTVVKAMNGLIMITSEDESIHQFALGEVISEGKQIIKEEFESEFAKRLRPISAAAGVGSADPAII